MTTDHQSSAELRLVTALLGRPPLLPFTVVDRCPDTTPRVLAVPPVARADSRWRPFPTIYWLSCPRLHHEVSRLESNGWVHRYTDQIAADTALAEAFLIGQRWLITHRRAQIPGGIDVESLPARVLARLDHTNIAGCRELLAIKCLHAHVAQHLAVGRNPVGAAVLDQIGECTAANPCRHWLTPAKEAHA